MNCIPHLALLCLVGCGSPSTKQSTHNDRPTTKDEASQTESSESTTEPTYTVDEACLKTCLQQNQARSVAWDIVTRDCTAACGGEPVPTLPD